MYEHVYEYGTKSAGTRLPSYSYTNSYTPISQSAEIELLHLGVGKTACNLSGAAVSNGRRCGASGSERGGSMAYEVIARKWRPQTFEDVVGQDHVVRTLRNAIESQRLAHAYLFVGPRGIGKTSIARLFARALNCEQGPTVKPCGACDACREIAAGNSLDVLEIDGASNTGVDKVRELLETVKFAPARGRFKIYLIDEVHMLSVAAFNALLKTLEEPPAHVKFFFATTEPHKILPTILSRCQRFDLRRIALPLIVERLKLIARSEKVRIDDDALLAVARTAEGGLRDAESALDQLISFCGREIAEADVLAVFGLVSRQGLDELVESVLRGDVRGIVERVAAFEDAGKDLARVLAELMEQFRHLLVQRAAGDAAGAADLTDAQRETVRRLAELADTERLLRILDVLTDADDRLKHTLSKRTLLETALIRCARAATTVSLEELLLQVRSLTEGAPPTAAGAGAATAAGAGAATAAGAQERARPGPRAAPASAAAEAPGPYAARPAAGGEGEAARLRANWAEIIKRAGRSALSAKSALADARVLRVEADTVVLGVDREFAADWESLKVPRVRAAVEQALGAELGRAVAVRCEAVDLESVSEAAPAAAAPAAAAPPVANDQKPKPSKRDWAAEPVVRKVLDLFEGSITEVRE